MILKAENLPGALLEEKDIWDGRYRSIRDLETHLTANGTRIINFHTTLLLAQGIAFNAA